jgi:uncharacterized membrane protein YdjX (TVP38/TMEM64 family)
MLMTRSLLSSMVLPLLLVQWFWAGDANSFQPFFSTTTSPTTTSPTTTDSNHPSGHLLSSSLLVNIMATAARRCDSNNHYRQQRQRRHHSLQLIDSKAPTIVSTMKASLSSSSPIFDVMFSLRGGDSSPPSSSSSSSESSAMESSSATTTTTTPTTMGNRASQIRALITIQKTALVVVSTTVLYGLFLTRESWVGILFDKNKLQSKTLETLQSLNNLPKVYSYLYYTMGMAIWEAIGLSTIPVETAAGMVFGWDGFLLSGIGKLSGATLAFMLGRYGVFASWIQKKLSQNSFLTLVQDSAADNPFLVACLFKFSCFPETIKNYGTAILRPIRLWMFVFGTILHGWTFTALWTYLGVDTAARLRDVALAPDRLLQVLLTLALINGVVVSPLSMAYWVRTLQKKAQRTSSVVLDVVAPSPPSENSEQTS